MHVGGHTRGPTVGGKIKIKGRPAIAVDRGLCGISRRSHPTPEQAITGCRGRRIRGAADQGQASGSSKSRPVSARSFAVLLPGRWESGTRRHVPFPSTVHYLLPHAFHRALAPDWKEATFRTFYRLRQNGTIPSYRWGKSFGEDA